MDLIHGYIYSSQPEKVTRPDGFFRRHLRGFGITISIVFHFLVLAWIIYRGLFAPFTQMSIVDEAYNEVKWVEIAKLSKPLKYPPSLLPHPTRAVPLEEMDKQIQETEKKKERKKVTKKKELEKE